MRSRFRSLAIVRLAIVCMVLAALLVLSSTWLYLWQLFGAANILMAALSLLIVAVWLITWPRWFRSRPQVITSSAGAAPLSA